MRHKIVAEVTMYIEAQDQAYAATDAEKQLFAICEQVYVKQAQKQATAMDDSGYGISKKSPVDLKPRRDPGISLTMVRAGK